MFKLNLVKTRKSEHPSRFLGRIFLGSGGREFKIMSYNLETKLFTRSEIGQLDVRSGFHYTYQEILNNIDEGWWKLK